MTAANGSLIWQVIAGSGKSRAGILPAFQAVAKVESALQNQQMTSNVGAKHVSSALPAFDLGGSKG